ncbi:MAG: SMP-30/gluconolactonase/LRE family protein [Methylotetracoccus sp.]
MDQHFATRPRAGASFGSWRISLLSAIASGVLAAAPSMAADVGPQSFVAPNSESYVSAGSFGSPGNLNDEFNTPNGAAFDAEGNIWVADTGNDRIVKYDAAGTFLFSFGAYGSADGLFSEPYDISVDRDGNLWVADTGNSRVQKFDGNGNFLCKLGGLSRPQGIGPHPTSSLVYVADTGSHSVVKVNLANCSNVGAWGSFGSDDGEFNTPSDVAIDAAGQVYVADYSNNRVQVFNANGGFLRKWGVYGNGDSRFQPLSSTVPPFPQGHFYGPVNLAIDPCGDVFVSDYNNDRIQLFRSDGTFVTTWGWKGRGAGQLDSPRAISIDYRGRVLVADRDNSRIQLFDPSTTDRTHLFSLKWGSQGTGDGLFSSPTGVAVDATNGDVYVADTNNGRIQVFDKSGIFKRKWGTFGSGAGQFNQPSDIAVNRLRDEVYVVEYGNSRVQAFTKQGQYLRSWGGSATLNGEFDNPRGIAVDSSDDRLYVADTDNSRVMVFKASNGDFQFGVANGAVWVKDLPTPSYGPGNRWFNGAWGVSVDESSHVIYVTDYGNKRVQKLAKTGAFLGAFGGLGLGNGQFQYPTGIVVDSEHNVLVVDSYSQPKIQKFNSSGRFITRWSSYGSNDGLMNDPRGVAVSADAGFVYVVEAGNDRVQRFRQFGETTTVTPATTSVKAGDVGTFKFSVKGVGPTVGTGQAVNMCLLSGRPSATTAKFTPATLSVNGGQTKSSTLGLDTSPSTAAKSYVVNVLTRGGGQTRVKSITLKVTK